MFFRNYPNILVAMEVGSSKVAVAVAEQRGDGSLVLLGVGEAKTSGVRKCEIVNFEYAKQSISHALKDAEEKTGVEISEVYLALSGAHIHSENVELTTAIHSEGNEILPEHLDDLDGMIRHQSLEPGYSFIHEVIRHYRLDDGSTVENPVGLSSRRLSAEYHLVSGITTRLQTTIRCVKELGVNVKGYALGSLATAQAVLSEAQKREGSIVVNCGAGATDWLAYDAGAVVDTGVIAVGGEHLTNDLALGLKLPPLKAEDLKVRHGRVDIDHEIPAAVVIPGDYSFEERLVRMDHVLTILNARQDETLRIVLGKLSEQPFWHHFRGTVYFTGGASRVPGFLELASEIFPVPVAMAEPRPVEGDQSHVTRPELATVMGMLRYAQIEDANEVPEGAFGSLRKFFAAMRLFSF
ncbi:cell division protein FtsA [Verrucomicrobium sp. GAS474]|uniref:cell division protein FtsA n=1 Tax=Verrucomicrobium sp. GAS474 TaxID=1882831 RepID=UPI00087A1ECE|nr:cell division protein FtsA [Verrucomicrobium sp. GAS474]SDU28703.1 cell division protein FtsA [Verrucomicrobium sp. GAS474]